jgi:hypothetical protein
MKISLFQMLALLVIGAISCSAQARGVQQPNRALVTAITTYLNSEPTAMNGVMAKQLTRMGDSAASTMADIIGQQVVDRTKLEKVLSILRSAFERPSIITNSTDRNPVATFALLNHLRQDPSWDAPTVAEIDSARQFVIAALKNSK